MGDKAQQLDKLKLKALDDNNLPLKASATNLVFGVGNPNAEILCIGEGPGYWEDQKAEPFVGNSGKLLDKLFALIGLQREDVYITNVVMHRPPENRDPSPEEIKAYQQYLDGIIDIISPKVIVTLGRFSMGKFFPLDYISSVHGKAREIIWKGTPMVVVCMYHPAAALRNGEIMRREKEDFLKLPELLEKITQKEVLKSDSIRKEVSQMKLL